MFSLGITAFHMVTGHLPYDTDDPAKIMKQIRTAPLPDPGKLLRNLPRHLVEFILKACEKDPDQRFQTPGVARQWLADRAAAVSHDRTSAGQIPVLGPCRFTDGRHETQDTLKNRHLDIAGATHIGLSRKTNQDRYLICLDTGPETTTRPAALLALADGLGGAIGGEIAADHVIRHLLHLAISDDETPLATLNRFFIQMDRDICAMAGKDPYLNGMGTTLTCAVLWDHTVFWVHSGDSRLYHLRGNTLTRITRDQTLADFLLREKEITLEQARTHYSRQVIEQYIGCQHLTPLSGTFTLDAGDMLILMSDGCYRHVAEEKTAAVCRTSATPARAAQTLVRLALDAGGTDNITVVVAQRLYG